MRKLSQFFGFATFETPFYIDRYNHELPLKNMIFEGNGFTNEGIEKENRLI